jgi:ligand-binding sensor domain-containing protein/signal transduction histidine kinase
MAPQIRFPLAIVVGLAWAVLSIPCRAERLGLRAYTATDGLACNQVGQVLQDSRGFLWIATEDGLSRFDGRTFRNFTRADGLPDVGVDAVAESTGGDLWVGTHAGLCRLHPNPAGRTLFERFSFARPPASEHVHALAAGRDGRIWVAAHDGLYTSPDPTRGRPFERVDLTAALGPDANQVIFSLHLAADGTLWCGTWGHVFAVGAEGHVGTIVRLPDEGDSANGIAEDAKGEIWLATRTGVARLRRPVGRGQARCEFVTREGPSPGSQLWVNDIVRTRDGHLWAASTSLIEIDPQPEPPRVLRKYGRSNGFCADGFASLFEDREANVWLAMQSCGLVRWERQGLVAYDAPDELGGISVASFVEDRAGDVCAAEVNRIDRWHCTDGRSFADLTLRGVANMRYIGWSSGQSAVQDSEGAWWLAAGWGLVRYPPERSARSLAGARPLTTYPEVFGPLSDVFRVYEDSRSDIWVGSLGRALGIRRWERSTGTLHALELDGSTTWQQPGCFAEDRRGTVWVGFLQGDLRRVEGDRLVQVPLPASTKAGSIPAMACDRAGRLWLATGEAGVWRIDDPSANPPRIRVYGRESGLVTDRVRTLCEGSDGRMYAGTSAGVAIIDPKTDRVQSFTTADGLANDVVNTIFRDRAGRLWFGTMGGVSMLGASSERAEDPPPVFVTGLTANGVPSPVSVRGESEVDGLTFGPGETTVEIRVSALAFAPGGPLRYQARLEGDRRWSTPSDQPGITLAHVAPGSYRALLRAVRANGTVSDRPAVVSFTVRPYFWRTWWFASSIVAAIAAIAASLYRARVRRQLALERIRTGIATDLHDDIGATLSQIAILSEVARKRLARGAGDVAPLMETVAREARRVVGSMSDVVWAVDPRHDRAEDLALRMRRFAEDLCAAQGIELKFSAKSPEGERMDARLRRQAFLIFKESVNNAAKHARCRTITIDLATDGHALDLVVVDDGLGFDPAAAASGTGLGSLRKRAAELGGSCEISSRPEEGTRVVVHAPLRAKPV